MKGNECRVVFFLHPVNQFKDGEVTEVESSSWSRLGLQVFLFLCFLLGLGMLAFVLVEANNPADSGSKSALSSKTAEESGGGEPVQQDGRMELKKKKDEVCAECVAKTMGKEQLALMKEEKGMKTGKEEDEEEEETEDDQDDLLGEEEVGNKQQTRVLQEETEAEEVNSNKKQGPNEKDSGHRQDKNEGEDVGPGTDQAQTGINEKGQERNKTLWTVPSICLSAMAASSSLLVIYLGAVLAARVGLKSRLKRFWQGGRELPQNEILLLHTLPYYLAITRSACEVK